MPLQWRTMQANDVARCAKIIATHPVIGPRYGSAIKDLPRCWLRLLGSEAMTTAVFEEVEKGRVTLAGVGVGVFVRDEFVRELKATPQFWFGAELPNAPCAQIPPCSPTRSSRSQFRRRTQPARLGSASSAGFCGT